MRLAPDTRIKYTTFSSESVYVSLIGKVIGVRVAAEHLQDYMNNSPNSRLVRSTDWRLP